jgi:hypothetical protein
VGKTAKIILSIVGVFILACIVGSVLFVRFTKKTFTALADEAQRQSTEARAWARGHQQGECMDEGMARVQRCPGIQCQIAVQTFTAACLSAAAPTAGLCDGVPHPQDFMATSQWINNRCMAFHSPQSAPAQASMRCRNLLPALQRHCFARALIAADAAAAAPPAVPAPVPAPAP